MGIIKEYVDRGVQTEADAIPSPYADPAVVLVAPPIIRRGVAEEPISTPSTAGSDNVHVVPQSPISPMLAPLVSRRLSRRRLARCPGGETVNRRVVSMPESKGEIVSHSHGKRIVSMPDRVRPVLEPSAELFQSPCTAAGDPFRSCNGRRERIRVFHTPSDVPQTPSPPSSPESLLIIGSGAQFPEGFLRRKYSAEPLIEEEEEDWLTWASSPPRPIPALHGPLSLPYARCPSGAEGTVIEEQDNVAQIIWGLGPDDQPHSQVRVECPSSHPGIFQNALSHGSSQVPPRLQKKRTSAAQVSKSRKQIQDTGHAKQTLSLQRRQVHEDKRSLLIQVSSDIETLQDAINGQSTPIDAGAPDHFINGADVSPVDKNRILEWQLARLRQALRTSLADMDPYTSYPGRLEPVIPAAVAPGVSQSCPRIFVEPRPNELVNSSAVQSPIEIAQQHRQQQLYRQAFQKQKLQIQNLLPTPPDSSSPQWSSQFSPHLTYCSALSPESVGSTEHLAPVSQTYRSGASASQNLRHGFDWHEPENGNDVDTSINISSAKPSKVVQNVDSVTSLRQGSSPSSTLARYIKQLQALSPIAQFSPLQPVPSSNTSLSPLPSTDNNSTSSRRTVHNVPVVHTPPSPESPQTLSRGSFSYRARSMAPIRPMQRRLSSVAEEDSALLDSSTSVSPSRLSSQLTDSISSSRDRGMGHQARYVDITRKSAIPDSPEFEGNVGVACVAFHETSPAKVRLPITREHNTREQSSRCHEQNREGHQYGHKKRHRYKKPKGPATTNEQATTSGLVA